MIKDLEQTLCNKFKSYYGSEHIADEHVTVYTMGLIENSVFEQLDNISKDLGNGIVFFTYSDSNDYLNVGISVKDDAIVTSETLAEFDKFRKK